MEVVINSPILLHMLGIPGAGKTTFLNRLLETWDRPPSPVLLGFDQVMQAMPEYTQYTDKKEAFTALELPARAQGYQMLEDFIAQQHSILFDNGGSAASHPDLLRSVQDRGYTIILVAIRTPVAVAAERVSLRAVTEGQHTPIHYLTDRAEKLVALESDYRAITPHFYEIINDGMDGTAFQQSCAALAKDIVARFS